MSKQALNDSELKEIETEKVGGLNTKVIEFTYKTLLDLEEEKIKAWISEDYGIPLKFEVRDIDTDKLKIKSEMSNFKVNTVKESMVEIPEEAITGVKEVCEETEEPYSDETINEILAKAKEPKNMRYFVFKRDFYEGTSLIFALIEVYQKNEKYKVERFGELLGTVYVSDGENIYQYYSTQDIYRKLDEGQIVFSDKPVDFADISEQILSDLESKETGKERVCGRNTRIVEFQ